MDLISLESALLTLVAAGLLALSRTTVERHELLLLLNYFVLSVLHPLAPLVFLATSLVAWWAARLAAGGAHRAVVWSVSAPLLVPLFLPKLGWLSGAAEGTQVGNVLGGSRLVLFVGASYYTLRALHFVIEARRRRELLLGFWDY